MLDNIIAFLDAQPMFTGLVGATLTGALLFCVRQLPHALFARLRALFTVTLTLEQREEAFLHVTTWLAGHQSVRRARRLMMAEMFDYGEGQWRWNLTLGAGWHIVRYDRRWLIINREVTQGSELAQLVGAGSMQRLWIMSFGRSQAPIRTLITKARAAYYGHGLVNVHVFDGGWVCVDRRRPRRMDTVFMPAAQKSRIVDDLHRFLAAREDYEARGVPWRRGYLFKGPPGTGKTTMIFACAGLLARPVYLLNLNNIQGDNQLIAAFNQVDRDGIVVIEDIDTVTITADRETAQPEPTVIAVGGSTNNKITLSGLLNAIDGLAAREGRLLFITSNHADKLDAALLRPGRIDMVEEIAMLDRETALHMIEAFGADRALADELRYPIAAADLQGRLLRWDGGADQPLRDLAA